MLGDKAYDWQPFRPTREELIEAVSAGSGTDAHFSAADLYGNGARMTSRATESVTFSVYAAERFSMMTR